MTPPYLNGESGDGTDGFESTAGVHVRGLDPRAVRDAGDWLPPLLRQRHSRSRRPDIDRRDVRLSSAAIRVAVANRHRYWHRSLRARFSSDAAG